MYDLSMKICIPYNATELYLESDYAQTVLQISWMLQKLGHKVDLIQFGETEWWKDALYLQGQFQIISSKASIDIYNLAIDIGCIFSPSLRNRLGNTIIGFIYTRALFQEVQSFSYAITELERYYDGLTEIWMWDCLNKYDDISCLQGIYKCSIRILPFFYDFSLIEPCIGEFINLQEKKRKKLLCLEKNIENTSCCIFPLLIMKSFVNKLKNNESIQCILYNREDLTKNTYFQENIVSHVDFKEDIRYISDIYSLVEEAQNGIIVSHIRFTPLHLSLLWIAWLGIPLIHNSLFLKDCGFEEGFYSGNSVIEAVSSLEKIVEEDFEIFKRRQKKWRDGLETKLGLDRARAGWQSAIHQLGSSCSIDIYRKLPMFQERGLLFCTISHTEEKYALQNAINSLFLSKQSLGKVLSSHEDVDFFLLRSRFYYIVYGLSDNKKIIERAISMGCIPLYIRTESDDSLWEWLSFYGVIECKSSSHAIYLIEKCMNTTEIGEKYQQSILSNYKLRS
jgi:hypothetical protein